MASIVLVLLALVTIGAPRAARAQDLFCEAGDTEVRRVRFTGNATFSDQELADSIVTTGANWLRRTFGTFGRRQCLDEDEVQRDALRLIIFYRLNGFYGVQVTPSIDTLGRNRVDVVFAIREGPPIILDSLAITGLPPADSARIMRGLDFGEGERYSRYVAAANVRQIIARLRNEGYPRADALIAQEVDTVDKVAMLHVDVQPGTRARIGEIRVRVEPAPGEEQEISGNTVRRITGLREGALYRERDLVNAQRTLYQLDAYRHVEVRLAPDSAQPPGDSIVAIEIGVIEGDMGAAEVGVGWATLDCVRTQARYIDRNFLGGARRMELTGRVWKIGVEQDWTPCGAARDDRYLDLNYAASATFSQPTLFGRGPRTLPTITVYSERRSEYRAFQRTTQIGLLATQRVEPVAGLPLVLSYATELGSTEAEPALFCAVFGACEQADRAQLGERQWLAVAGASWLRDRTDNPFSPNQGSVMRLDFRHASKAIGSSEAVQFNKLVGDAARYWRIGDGQVLAARLRLGGVFGTDFGAAEHFIPPQERLYAGGPSTVRGYGQNELGPIIYRVDAYDTIPGPADTVYYRAHPDSTGSEVLPKGGNTLVVGNVEYRIRSPFLPELLQWTAFLDAGLVWNREDEPLTWRDLHWTPGIGLRALTLIGAVRVDVGYNPYPPRGGAAYYDAPPDPNTGRAPLFCVSPTNEIPIVGGQQVPGADLACPTTFQPGRRGGFFERLSFSFSIGQAF